MTQSIANTSRSETIFNLTEILAILTRFDNAYNELQDCESKHIVPEKVVIPEISEPDPVSMPNEPIPVYPEGKAPVLLFLFSICICVLPVICQFPGIDHIADNRLYLIELIALAAFIILFIVSLISYYFEKKRCTMYNAAAAKKYEAECETAKRQNENLQNKYRFLVQQAIELAEEEQKRNEEKAKRDNAMIKLQADKARNTMNIAQKKYMQKYGGYLPEKYANIESVKALLKVMTEDESITSLKEAVQAVERGN